MSSQNGRWGERKNISHLVGGKKRCSRAIGKIQRRLAVSIYKDDTHTFFFLAEPPPNEVEKTTAGKTTVEATLEGEVDEGFNLLHKYTINTTT